MSIISLVEGINSIYDYSVCWQMSPAERACLKYLISNISKNHTAIEIGSYCGGSLRSLSQNFNKVYSCDINHNNIDNIEQYNNVEFIEGDSKVTVSELIDKINDSDEIVNLIIIDADHEYNGVFADIQNVLKIKPKQNLAILMHDSWYTPTRMAICDTKWSDNPHVHFIDTDFCAGDLVTQNLVMGGLALILLSPEIRTKDLVITQSQDAMYLKLNNL